MREKMITASAPATVANVACGFDVLGFAVNAPRDIVTLYMSKTPGIRIHAIEGIHGDLLSRDPQKNTAGVALQHFLKELKYGGGLEIHIQKNLPLGSGMGSSAASAAAALCAANALFGNPFSRKQLIPFAMEAEKIACGTAHADNVAPALLGGFILIRSYTPLDIVEIPYPENLYCTIIHPHIELRTSDSRKVLREEISLKSAITQWGNVAGLVSGLITRNFELIGRSMEDVIIEPLRGKLIPGFHEVKQAALTNEVLGCSISGSGPSVFALSTTENIAHVAAKAMQKAFEMCTIKSDAYVSSINMKGAEVIPNPEPVNILSS
jgi:homoserine kinase